MPLQVNLYFHGFIQLLPLLQRPGESRTRSHSIILSCLSRNFTFLTKIFFPFLGISADPISLFSELSGTNRKMEQEVAAGEFCAG